MVIEIIFKKPLEKYSNQKPYNSYDQSKEFVGF